MVWVLWNGIQVGGVRNSCRKCLFWFHEVTIVDTFEQQSYNSGLAVRVKTTGNPCHRSFCQEKKSSTKWKAINIGIEVKCFLNFKWRKKRENNLMKVNKIINSDKIIILNYLIFVLFSQQQQQQQQQSIENSWN